jgi:hypothetical protein
MYGERNLIALRFCDWGGGGGPWKEPCLLTIDPDDLPQVPEWSAYIDGDSILQLEIELMGFGKNIDAKTASIHIDKTRGGRLNQMLMKGIQGRTITESLPLRSSDENSAYSIEIELLDSKRANILPRPLAKEVTPHTFPPTQLPDGVSEARNNFVWELETTRTPNRNAVNIAFNNPREGWILLTLPDGYSQEHAPIFVSGRDSPLRFRQNIDTLEWESMEFLEEGEHDLILPRGFSMETTVRTIPELAYSYYPCTPHIQAHGGYDWEYLGKYILPNLNVLITHGVESENIFDEWRSSGGKWIGNAGLPGLSGPPPNAADVFKYWAGNIGVTHPNYAGMIVDEFIGASPVHYRAWGEAAKKLFALPEFEGKTFYAWCGDLYKHTDQPTKEFINLLMEGGHRFALEKYLDEPPTEKEAKRSLYRSLKASHEGWKEAYPGWENHVLICLGYLSAPPESLNVNPGVDYKVYMDMQFHHLATDPSFWGLYGIMEYTTSYADEEIVRWAHRLFRHYCIEGSRERFTDDPYILPHLLDPDFEQGVSHWTSEPAEEGSIETGSMEGFSWLQGRYPETTRGDTYLVMKRSGKGPNRVSQTIEELDPGRLYSVKLISAAIDDLHEKQDLGIRIEIEGADIRTDLSFKECFPSNYAHERGEYTRERPAHFNYHRVVFQPKAETAELTLSDWKSESEPGATVGQRIALNFVEAQPFFAD